ncbi:hypothetical protein [Aegicerativicinus sediminis]|uniref:hypothetical protein n=1 Tax=Aegicerativicinus sediminis TaxID=2893202 RepID=UPI001E488EB9|nr:hypothetical protein [Aegicerativicinus sediminis]
MTKSSLIMYGAPHSYYMEHGRGPGPADYRKLAPFMLQWIEVKEGLPAIFYEEPKRMSFAIAHKVATQGIKVPNEHNQGEVLNSVIDDFIKTVIPKMLDELGDVFLSRLRADIVGILKNELTAA